MTVTLHKAADQYMWLPSTPGPTPLVFGQQEIPPDWSTKDTGDYRMTRDRQCARDGGLLPKAEEGDWYCQYCGEDIRDGTLESHVGSKRHEKRRQWQQDEDELRQKLAKGEMPEWMELRPSAGWECQECCSLCDAYATVEHLASRKHRQKVEGWEVIQKHARGENENWLELREGREYCRACNAYNAAGSHVMGAKHKKRMAAWVPCASTPATHSQEQRPPPPPTTPPPPPPPPPPPTPPTSATMALPPPVGLDECD